MSKRKKHLGITIVATDSNEIFLHGLISTFRTIETVTGVSSARNSEELFIILQNVQINIICLDLDMPKINAKKTVEEIRKSNGDCKILLLSSSFEKNLIRILFKAGANGFILKNTSSQELQIAISKLIEKSYYLGDKEQETLAKDSLYPGLSKSSDNVARDLLYLISHELTTKQIAHCLMLSEKTIEYHRTNLIKSLGVKNMTGLAVYAVQHHIYSDFSLKNKYQKWI
jgi:two-component system, NarL family, response regulator NreC